MAVAFLLVYLTTVCPKLSVLARMHFTTYVWILLLNDVL